MLLVHIEIACMRQFQCVTTTTYVFSINEFFTICFLKQILNQFHLFIRNEHVEMNNFLCSLPCTWIVNFILLTAYLWMFHWNEMLTWWLPGCNRITDCMENSVDSDELAFSEAS